jgi:hypothetical protein
MQAHERPLNFLIATEKVTMPFFGMVMCDRKRIKVIELIMSSGKDHINVQIQ